MFERIFFCFLLFSVSFFYASPALSDDAAVLKPTTDFSRPEPFEALPAGALTQQKTLNKNAFSLPSANMSFERQLDFTLGNALFRKLWVSSPASTQSSDGLGPLFNARSCQRCHIKDGRGHPPMDDQDNRVSMLMRLAIPAQNEQQRIQLAKGQLLAIADPVYGGQLQDHAVAGIPSEGKFVIRYREILVPLADGQMASLRQPDYTLVDLAYGQAHPELMISPRIAPQMIGLGLLEAISEADILSYADPLDSDGDGISGKAQRVWSHEAQRLLLGRFGHKAGSPSLNQQNQAAFNGDIGLSTPLFPKASGDCTQRQTKCLAMPNGNATKAPFVEVDEQMAALVLHYTRNLAVPARRDLNDADVLAGKRLFYESGCTDCHRPKYITPRRGVAVEQRRQLIWPYTDLLLHDMGDGLADGLSEGQANGREWRTPPLWGIGLTSVVNGHQFYLHDGRARNLLEAILWHGGEAQAAKEKVVAMSAKARKQLLRFIESL